MGVGEAHSAREAFFDGVSIDGTAFESRDLCLRTFPKCHDFAPELVGKPLVALVELGMERTLPLGQPGTDFPLKLGYGRRRAFAGLQGRNLLDLCREPLGFLPLLGETQFGVFAGGVAQALDVFLECLEFGLIRAQPVVHQRGRRHGGRSAGFQAGNT